MFRHTLAFGLAFAAALYAAPTFAQPASAVGAREKMDTCKFGAAEQKLQGKAEQDFIRKCMANEPAVSSKSNGSPASGGATMPPRK